MKPDYLTSSFIALREKLHRSALGFLKNDEDARDALQDTFSHLWDRGAIESEAEARNKLFAVLRNICIDRLRRPVCQSLNREDIPEPTEEPVQGEDMERLENLLTTGLSDLQRQIYHMITHLGMEYESVASELGMTVIAVRTNMCRARSRIRDNYNRLNR